MALAKDPALLDPRRADDRTRRDGGGGGARSRRTAPGGTAHVGALHQPQPRRDRRRCAPASACSTRSPRRGGTVETVLQDPRHPYTVGLLRCIPRGGVRKDHGRLDTIPGFLPSLGAELTGCVFADRCALADDRCRSGGAAADRRRGRARRAGAGTTTVHRSLPRQEARGHRASTDRPRRRSALVRDPASSRQGLQAARRTRFSPRRRSARRLARRDAGLVGESGSGKTTLGRTLLGIVAADAGTVELEGTRAPAPLPEALAGRACARSRSSSRTRTRRSTDATRCGGSCCARSASSRV